MRIASPRRAAGGQTGRWRIVKKCIPPPNDPNESLAQQFFRHQSKPTPYRTERSSGGSDAGLRSPAMATTRHLPLTRAECIGGPRPCPFVSCRHHLYLDIHDSGSTTAGKIVVRHPEGLRALMTGAVEGAPESCSLDVADSMAEHSLEEIAALVGLDSRQHANKIEAAALMKLKEELTK